MEHLLEHKEAEALFHKNKDFAYFYLHKYLRSKAFDEDIQQIAFMALWRACLCFEPAKGTSFTALASKFIFNDLAKHFRENQRKWGKTVTFTDEEDLDHSGKVFKNNSLFENVAEVDNPIEAIDTYNTITELFDETEKKIFDMLVADKSQIEIGKEIGCSPQNVSLKIQKMKLKALVSRSRTN